MSEVRYNIPRQYKVDKGMPLDALFTKIDNLKCRRIFSCEILSVEWCYHLVDKKGIKDATEIIGEPGVSVFEVQLKHEVAPDLLTEVFAGILQRPIVMVYMCGNELSMGTFIPAGKGTAGRMCSTDFYPYDEERMIEVLDYEMDSDKSAVEIHRRIYATLRRHKRAIMIEKAFEKIGKDNEKDSFAFEFSFENLEKIRADADFVQSQLKVV